MGKHNYYLLPIVPCSHNAADITVKPVSDSRTGTRLLVEGQQKIKKELSAIKTQNKALLHTLNTKLNEILAILEEINK